MHFWPIYTKDIHQKLLEIDNLDIFLVYCGEFELKSAETPPGGPFQS